MKHQLLLIVAINLSFSHFSSAQSPKEHYPESYSQLSGLSDQQKLKELVSIHQGTYQLRVTNENYAPVLSLIILETIINSRQQTASVTFEIDEFTRVFIPSIAAIDDDTFTPLQTIVYDIAPESDELNN